MTEWILVGLGALAAFGAAAFGHLAVRAAMRDKLDELEDERERRRGDLDEARRSGALQERRRLAEQRFATECVPTFPGAVVTYDEEAARLGDFREARLRVQEYEVPLAAVAVFAGHVGRHEK